MDDVVSGERLVAQRLRDLRTARGWSQGQLAERLTGVGCPLHQTAISRLEKPSAKDGRRAITLDEAMALARVFEMPLAQLIAPAPSTDELESLISRFNALRHEYVAARKAAVEARLAAQAADHQLSAASQEATEFRARVGELAVSITAALDVPGADDALGERFDEEIRDARSIAEGLRRP